MTNNFKSDSDHSVSHLLSVARSGELKAVIGELISICRETTVDRCLALTLMVPALSVETARIAVRTDDQL